MIWLCREYRLENLRRLKFSCNELCVQTIEFWHVVSGCLRDIYRCSRTGSVTFAFDQPARTVTGKPAAVREIHNRISELRSQGVFTPEAYQQNLPALEELVGSIEVQMELRARGSQEEVSFGHPPTCQPAPVAAAHPEQANGGENTQPPHFSFTSQLNGSDKENCPAVDMTSLLRTVKTAW